VEGLNVIRSGRNAGGDSARPAVSHPEPGAFVADFEHLDAAELVQLVHPVHVAVAHQAEDVGNAFRLERAGQSLIHLHGSSRC
jgi:hypothetical protein